MQTSDYVYNATAADLSRRRSTTIGVIIPTTRSLVFSTSLLAIQEAGPGEQLHDHGRQQQVRSGDRVGPHFTVPGTAAGRHHSDRVSKGPGRCSSGALARDGMPCVVIWDKLDEPDLSYVGFDNRKATYAITEYLIGLRHTAASA